MSETTYRWSKFFWADWQNDKALQGCSLAARGLWIELLAIMHTSERRGYMLINGLQPSVDELSDMLGKCTAKEVAKLLEELEAKRVFSREADGTIYCRRMVRDTVASEVGREHIAKRWNGKANGQHPNSPPNRSPTRDPTSHPIRDPITKKLEVEEEERPPRSPPVGGARAARRPKPHRNGFVELERRLAAASNGGQTIEGHPDDIVDFQQFSQKLRRIADG